MARFANNYTYKQPEKKWYSGGLSALQTIGDIISRPNYASANVAKTLVEKPKATPIDLLRSGFRGLAGKDKTTYKDVLTSAGYGDMGSVKVPFTKNTRITGKGALGFAGDILLDPTTYLTLGTGTGAKISLQQGGKNVVRTLSKKATRELGEMTTRNVAKGMTKTAARNVAEKEIAKRASVTPKLLDRGGIKFGIGEAKVTLPGSYKITEPISDFARSKGFKLFSRDKKLAYENIPARRMGQEYRDILAGRKNVTEATYSNAFRKLAKKDRVEITKAIYNNSVDKLPVKLKKAAEFAQKEFSSIAGEEVERGLLKKTLRDYVTQYYKETPQPKQVGLKPDKTIARLGTSKKRVITGANYDEYLKNARKAGLEPEDDIAKILLKRKISSIRQVEKSKFQEEIGKFYKDKSNLPAGEDLVSMPKIKELQERIPIKMSAAERASRVRVAGKELGKTKREIDDILRASGDIPEELAKRESVLKAKYTRAKKFENTKSIKIPRSVAEFIEDIEETVIGNEALRKSLNNYDKAQNFIKASLTVLFPSFHFRNLASNVMQNWLNVGLISTLNPKLNGQAAILAAGKMPNKTIKLAGQTYKFSDLHDLMIKNQVLQSPGFFDVPSGSRNALFAGGSAVARGIENQSRVVAFLANLSKYGDPVTAAAQTKKFLFDYSNLNWTEKAILKRVFPFWTWTSKNAVLQAEQLIKQPGKFATQFKIKESLQKELGTEISEDDYNSMPEWMKNSFVVKVPGENGKFTYYYSFGTPIEEFSETIQQPGKKALSMLSPLLKYPAERALGRSFFYDKPISEMTDARNLKSLMEAPSAVPGGNKVTDILKGLASSVGYEERPAKTYSGEDYTRATASPDFLHLLGSSPLSRVASTAGQVSDEGKSGANRVLKTFSGISSMETDKETQDYYADKRYKEQMVKPFEQKGLIKKGQYGYYVSKNIGMSDDERNEANYIVNVLNSSSGNKKVSDKDMNTMLLYGMLKQDPTNELLKQALFSHVTGIKPKKTKAKKPSSAYVSTPKVTLRTVKTTYKKPPSVKTKVRFK